MRDRIVALERVPAASLRANPKNWRTHPEAQRVALRDLVGELGMAVPLVARRMPDGSLELLDGHLRAETLPDEILPVVVLDVNDAEAAKLLATIDPLSAIAEQDDQKLIELMRDVQTESAAVMAMLGDLLPNVGAPTDAEMPPESFEILVSCSTEAEQCQLLERFAQEGIQCRSLVV